MYFMSDPQTLHVTRNVIPGKLGVDLHLHRVHIPLVLYNFEGVGLLNFYIDTYLPSYFSLRITMRKKLYIKYSYLKIFEHLDLAN